MTGAPQPENPLNPQKLDVDSQSTASSTMKIHIDEWAGTFQGQQRERLEVLIDPVLKELDATLLKALEHLKPVSGALGAAKPFDEELKTSLKGSETQIERAQSLVADLVKKTDGSPYAFIGLQLVDIIELHISPARIEVKATSTDPAEKRMGHTQQAEFHLTRAREMLAELNRQYESAKRDAKLAENMQRIKKMYQVFLEETFTALGSNKPSLNPKDRKMAELELDEEFMKQYTEIQKQWQEVLKQLAKALAEDPRLLERYMNASRKNVDTLRDQLTILNSRQQELMLPVDQLLKNPGAKPAADKKEDPKEPTATTFLETSQRRDLADIAQSLTSVQEDFKTWMPKTAKTDDPKIVAATEQSTKVAALANVTADLGLKSEDKAQAEKKAVELATELKTLEDRLSAVVEGAADQTQLIEHANRRLAVVRKSQENLAAWAEKNKHLEAAELHRVVEIDQHRLADDTLVLSDKLENLEAQLAGVPGDILDIADEIKQTMRFDVLVDQMNAELKLRDSDLPAAKEHQQKAIEGLARAESQFDKLIDRVIEEQDKVPPQVPDLDNFQLQSLEDLLAILEAEQTLAETLGIPNRPTNLQQLQAWMMRNSNGQGFANSFRSGAQNRAQMTERARQEALRKLRKANETRDAKPVNAKAKRWNTLSSRLDDVLRQGRGNTPPKQYRRAIEQYFEMISGAEGAASAPDPAKAPAAAPNTEAKQ